MELGIFIQLAVILIVAFIIAYIMRMLKQPLLIGYILTGIILGPYVLNMIGTTYNLQIFAKIGIAFLLFIVGLSLNPHVIREVGKTSLITGLGQILFTSTIVFLICQLLGFSLITAIYIAIALSFSSTIIIMKLLSDKGDLNTLYGKISIGFLIVQDFVAIFALMFISSMSGSTNLGTDIITTLVKGGLLIGFLIFLGFYFLPKFTKVIAKNQELLLLFSVSWCLLLAALFSYLNLSIEIGALVAGITLSISPYRYEISSKMRPLRDFFIIIFFIALGSQMILETIYGNLGKIIVFSLFILIGNPLIVLTLMGLLGYTRRTGFLCGLTVAQISEFSLILISLGIVVRHINQEVLSIITAVALITMTGSTYLFLYSGKVYDKIKKHLCLFERKCEKREYELNKVKEKDFDAVLFGYNRIGYSILKSLSDIKKRFLVVDYNPETISHLTKFKIPCFYGDVDDQDLLNDLPLNKIKLAVSTIPDFETNYLLINSIKSVNKKAIIIVRASQLDEALDLYKEGADYVLTPHYLGGEYVSDMIRQKRVDEKGYKDEKNKHIQMLKKRLEIEKKYNQKIN